MPRHVTGLTIYIGDEGALYYRGPTRFSGSVVEGGDLIPIEIPADWAAQESTGQPYVLSIASAVPEWVATPAAETAMVPTLIGVGETFTVPVNRQAVYAIDIINNGDLVVNGDLIMVG